VTKVLTTLEKNSLFNQWSGKIGIYMKQDPQLSSVKRINLKHIEGFNERLETMKLLEEPIRKML
jgi:hypothetical protein